MKFKNILPGHLHFALLVVGVNLSLFILFRLLFLAFFGYQASEISGEILVKAFYLGLKFDLRLALLMVLPLVLLAWIPGLEMSRFRIVRILWQGTLVLLAVGSFWFFLADLGHYAYLNTRINSTILQFLTTPAISASMVWESYPVIWAGLGLVLFGAGYGWIISHLTSWVSWNPRRKSPLWQRGIATTGCLILLLLGLYGKMAYYPLRWSEAFFSPQPIAVALGLNPVLYFFDTIKAPKRDFDLEKARQVYPLMASYLGIDQPNPDTMDFRRKRTPLPLSSGKPNVVVIILESFAAHKVGTLGNPLPSTPNFDALAGNGLLFTNFFTPTTGTARSIFASLVGIPDININTTATHNPLMVDQHTIINGFDGYEKMYFIGGSANWRNLRGVLTHNIQGLRIYEEEDYDQPHNDVWGVSDLHLFMEANKGLQNKGKDKPFFAIIQTAGNHRPYTIPEDSGGYRMLDPKVKDMESKGFQSVEEFNSFRFLDHTLGEYFRLARKEAYFKNTLFFIYGDHGLPGSAAHLPPGMGEHQLTQHHVPFLIYAPELIKSPARIDTIVSQLDVMPTVASITGTPYTNTTLGRNMLKEGGWDRQYAFIFIPYQNPSPTGLIDKEYFFKIEADGTRKLFKYRSTDSSTNLVDRLPDIASQMERHTEGFFQSARYLLFNNSSSKIK